MKFPSHGDSLIGWDEYLQKDNSASQFLFKKYCQALNH